MAIAAIALVAGASAGVAAGSLAVGLAIGAATMFVAGSLAPDMPDIKANDFGAQINSSGANTAIPVVYGKTRTGATRIYHEVVDQEYLMLVYSLAEGEIEGIEQVYLAAAKVGGIHANNTYPADFIYDNLIIESNLIHAAHQARLQKLLFLGSSFIYPRNAQQPMREEALLTGPLEPTNEPYAIAKIAGIKLCQAYRKQYGSDFISAMPTNLYGTGDNYDLTSSHVAAALMVKAHHAKVRGDKEIESWGTVTPQRAFLFVEDLADGLVFLIQN